MYNMDESGFSIGNIKGAQVVVDTTLLTKYQAHPGRQEWATVIECISAIGSLIPPLIILKGKNCLSFMDTSKCIGEEHTFFVHHQWLD